MVFNINPDITKAETLPATFYKDPFVFETVKEKVFLNTWQWIGDENLVKETQSVHPFILLDDFLTFFFCVLLILFLLLILWQ